ncbi:MAG: transglutaminase-like domain-containing protein, partial [Tannerella sp.]|nr:transglutaminase-like domain-containing protein [Tannerella sp.]
MKTSYFPICKRKYIRSISCIGIAIVIFAACGSPSRLEQALDFAGENRMELEKVLKHYSSNPADSLKYRAARFLIENMPYHYSFSSKAIDSFVAEVQRYASQHEYAVHQHNRHHTTQSFDDTFPAIPSSRHNIVMDSHVITSAFLIDNIEQAFKVWQEQPWASGISFDDFCEQILPYRVSDEPLQDWRRLYYDYFKPGLDSICGNTADLTTAGKAVYDLIYNNRRWIFDNSVTSKYTGAETLFHTRLGDCRLMANYAVYAFRALGIPCGIDMILQNPDMMYKQHYWNYMKDNSGKTIRFEIHQMAPETDGPMNRKTGKIYRSFFGLHPGLLHEKFHTALPPPLNERLIMDVTDEYYPGVTLPKDIWKDRKRYLYLGVFNNSAWIPVACIDTKDRKHIFEYMEPEIAYRPLCYTDGIVRESGFPVILSPGGSIRILEPDTVHRRRLELGRKYPFPGWYVTEKHRSAGGRFEVANDSLFRNPTV